MRSFSTVQASRMQIFQKKVHAGASMHQIGASIRCWGLVKSIWNRTGRMRRRKNVKSTIEYVKAKSFP